MAKGGGGGGRIARVAGQGLNNPTALTTKTRIRLQSMRDRNVAQDKILYRKERTSTGTQLEKIKRKRQVLSNKRLAIDFGTRRASQLIK